MNRKLIERGVCMIIEGLLDAGETDHNFDDTPRRVADVYEELFVPRKSNHNVVFDEDYTDVVLVRGHVFYTLCPHHLLPVELTAHVAYMPAGKVLGASKLIRLISECSTRPMTQERLTSAILTRLNELTEHTSTGGACMLIGKHGCFSMRGVRSHAADMKTLKYAGVFEEPQMQQRFLDMVTR